MTAAASRSSTGRHLWRRYRAPVLAAIPVGLVVGVAVGLAFSVRTVSASAPDRLPALLAYACLGAGFSAVACAGAVVSVLLGRRRTAGAQTPFIRIAAGAELAVAVGVLLAGGISAAMTDSWAWYPATAVVAVVSGLVAGAAAVAITAFFEFKDRLLP